MSCRLTTPKKKFDNFKTNYLTAKKCGSRRFHALYDKVYRDDVLYEAWKRVKANKGSNGIDGIAIEDIEAKGVERYLTRIQSELKSGTYRPLPVRRVMIPKSDGMVPETTGNTMCQRPYRADGYKDSDRTRIRSGF